MALWISGFLVDKFYIITTLNTQFIPRIVQTQANDGVIGFYMAVCKFVNQAIGELFYPEFIVTLELRDVLCYCKVVSLHHSILIMAK